MTVTSTLFLFFLSITAFIYYRVKIERRWMVLLISSIIFYCSYGFSALIFVLVTSLSVYCAALGIERNAECKARKKSIVTVTLIFNFGILIWTKCGGYLPDIFRQGRRSGSLLVPIGISYYTFQVIGYLLDVYWGRDRVENNYFKLLLFTIFFPQILQGQISRHKSLAYNFENNIEYDFLNIKYGIQLMVWGFFKKIVIADTIATAANEVLHNPTLYTGSTVIFGVLAYSIELYADFSGGIDIIRGSAQCFGIELAENFKRPFFFQSIQEFWRRWHITLGTWMKDYLFYPMALSKTMNRLAKKCQAVFGRKTGRKIPICIENIIVFTVVGLWHGISLHFLIYGLYNGIIIAVSTLLEPVYEKMYGVLHINKTTPYMRLFRIIRTFILVNIGWYFDDVKSLSDSIVLMRNTLLPNNTFYDGTTYLGLFKYQYGYVAIGIVVVFIVSVLQEKGMNVRGKIDTLPYLCKMSLWLALIFMIPIMGWDPSVASGFMYANF